MTGRANARRCVDQSVIDPAEVRISGRRPSLTPEQVAEAQRRIKLYRENTRQRIAADLGVALTTLDTYLRGNRPLHWGQP